MNQIHYEMRIPLKERASGSIDAVHPHLDLLPGSGTPANPPQLKLKMQTLAWGLPQLRHRYSIVLWMGVECRLEICCQNDFLHFKSLQNDSPRSGDERLKSIVTLCIRGRTRVSLNPYQYECFLFRKQSSYTESDDAL